MTLRRGGALVALALAPIAPLACGARTELEAAMPPDAAADGFEYRLYGRLGGNWIESNVAVWP